MVADAKTSDSKAGLAAKKGPGKLPTVPAASPRTAARRRPNCSRRSCAIASSRSRQTSGVSPDAVAEVAGLRSRNCQTSGPKPAAGNSPGNKHPEAQATGSARALWLTVLDP